MLQTTEPRTQEEPVDQEDDHEESDARYSEDKHQTLFPGRSRLRGHGRRWRRYGARITRRRVLIVLDNRFLGHGRISEGRRQRRSSARTAEYIGHFGDRLIRPGVRRRLRTGRRSRRFIG